MKDAVRKGHMGCLKLMAESVRSRFLLKSAFTFFAKSQVEEMKRDMDYFFGDVLEYAARNGHLECMKMMLKYVDPKVKESSALRSAAYSGHEDCFCCCLCPTRGAITLMHCGRGAIKRTSGW